MGEAREEISRQRQAEADTHLTGDCRKVETGPPQALGKQMRMDATPGSPCKSLPTVLRRLRCQVGRTDLRGGGPHRLCEARRRVHRPWRQARPQHPQPTPLPLRIKKCKALPPHTGHFPWAYPFTSGPSLQGP